MSWPSNKEPVFGITLHVVHALFSSATVTTVRCMHVYTISIGV